MCGVAGDEDMPDAQLCNLAVMDANNELQCRARTSIPAGARSARTARTSSRDGASPSGFLDSGDYAPASGAHRENNDWPEFARAQLQLVGG